MARLLYKNQKITYSELPNFIKKLPFNDLEEWEIEIFHFLIDWFNPSINQFKVQTSGSTGVPKKIELHRDDMIHSAKFTINRLKLSNTSKATLCIPAKYIGGKMMVVRALVGEYNLDLIQPDGNPTRSLSENCDFIALTPYQLQKSLLEGDHEKLKKIKTIIIGGGSLPRKTLEVISKWNNEVYITYGMTESISHIALAKIDSTSSKLIYELISPQFKLSLDERGCLTIKTPYKHEPVIASNDIVDLINESTFVWKGRYDNTVNSGGIKIYPEELEQKFQHIIDVPFFIAGEDDELLGQKLILLIEKKKGFSSYNLIENLAMVVPEKYHLPKKIIELDKFQYTENNKIDRSKTLSSIN